MAVHTAVAPEQAATFLDRYEVGTLESLEGVLQGVENTTYLVRTTQKNNFILTLYEKRTKKKICRSFYL